MKISSGNVDEAMLLWREAVIKHRAFAHLSAQLANAFNLYRSLDEALDWIADATVRRVPLSVGLVGNAADVVPELHRRGVCRWVNKRDRTTGSLPRPLPARARHCPPR